MKIFWRLLALLSYSQYCHALKETTDPLQESAETVLDNSCQNDGTCQQPAMASTNSSQCGVYLAMSTLPGTGIGMFAGKSFKKGDVMMPAGDHLVPIVDVELNHGTNFFFLWDEYTWVRTPIFSSLVRSVIDFL
jgi:hypothetical protein